MNEKPSQTRSYWKWLIAVPMFVAGLLTFAHGVHLETLSPRSEEDEVVSLRVLGLGTALIVAGVSVPFCRPRVIAIVALISPFVAYYAFVFLFWAFIFGFAIVRLCFEALGQLLR